MKVVEAIGVSMADPFRNMVGSLACLLLWGTSVRTAAADAHGRPQRIISMNLCTDQMLLYLVEPERIHSLVYLSYRENATPERYVRAIADKPLNHGLAEEVMRMKPDLVLAGKYSTRTTTPLLQRMGVRVEVFEPENSFEDMRSNIRKLGEIVGEAERAEKLIADFDHELAALKAQVPPGRMAIYADIGNNIFMQGDNTLSAEVFNAAGFRTIGQEMGFKGSRRVPVELLIQQKPDLISIDNPYSGATSMASETLNHPLIRRMVKGIPQFDLPARYTVCGTPEMLEGVRQLVEVRKKLGVLPPRESGLTK